MSGGECPTFRNFMSRIFNTPVEIWSANSFCTFLNDDVTKVATGS